MPKWKKKRNPASTARAELERFLELNCPGNALAKLRLIILHVLLQCPEPREAIIGHARAWDMNAEKAEEFLRGDVEFGFRWYSIEGVLSACGAEPTYIEVAHDLFNEFPRRDHPVVSPVAVVPQPLDVTGSGTQDDVHDNVQDPAETEECPDGPPHAEADTAGVDQGAGIQPSTGPVTSGGLKPDPLQARTAEQFVTMMRAYRVWAGRPSYRKMATAIGGRYVQSTLSTVGAKKALPKIDLVLAYIEGCGGDAADLDAWREAWRRIELTQPERTTDTEPG